MFSFSVSGEDVTPSAITDANEKISTVLSSKIAEASVNEKIPVIILLADQSIAINTADGKAKIDKDQREFIKFFENEKAKTK